MCPPAGSEHADMAVTNVPDGKKQLASLSQMHDASKDAELLSHLKLMRLEDEALAQALAVERREADATIERIHRANNFRIDEAHIREANIAEAQFLADMQDLERKWIARRQEEEAADLKEEEETQRMLNKVTQELRALKLGVRQREEARQRVISVKRRLQERRATQQIRMQALEVRQQRERQALQESHARIIKNTSLYRNLLLQEYEDSELKGLIINSSGSSDRLNELQQDRLDSDKVHESKMLQLKLRMQKEVEQLREEHLLRLKHMLKTSELELNCVEEMETLAAEHMVEELAKEAEQKKEGEELEESLDTQLGQIKSFQVQRQLQMKAQRVVHSQRQEARQLVRAHKVAAKQRERLFIEAEEELAEERRQLEVSGDIDAEEAYSAHRRDSEMGSEYSGVSGGGDERRKNGSGSVADRSDYSGTGTDFSDASEMTSGTNAENAADDEEHAKDAAQQGSEIEEQIRKNHQAMANLSKKHDRALQELQAQQREVRASVGKEHRELASALQAELEDEYKALKAQHAKEMAALLKVQSVADQLEADNKVSNNLLYEMLPKYVADDLKMGRKSEPRDFDCVTILYSDIVQFTNLTSQSTSSQIVNLLNRLYTAFDTILDDYSDVYKTETIGDAYQIVGGLDGQSGANVPAPITSGSDGGSDAGSDAGTSSHSARLAAREVVECAIRFMDAVFNLDMSDQVKKELQIRIGVHSGPAVGGVAGSLMPKFALFGDTVNIAGQMEQKSQPTRIHVSETTYNLVKGGDYEFQPAGEVTLEGGLKMRSFWLMGWSKTNGAKAAGESSGRNSSAQRLSSAKAKRKVKLAQ